MTAPSSRVSAAVRDALEEALGLVFPTWCAGCGRPDVPLCADCRDALTFRGHARRVAGLEVVSAVAFEGAAARAIRAFKEDGRTGLARALGPLLATGVHRFGDAEIVPMPSSRAAMRRRGYPVAELLARRGGLRIAPLLVRRGTPDDQRALGRAARLRNVEGTFRARRADGRTVVLVDDVVTTGASLREAAHTLEEAGAVVLGAATVATTLRSGVAGRIDPGRTGDTGRGDR